MTRASQKNSLIGLGVFLAFALFTSCDNEEIYFQKFTEIENSSWVMDKKIPYEFEVKDTSAVYNFSFNLRNTNDYQYSNLFIFWQLQSPDGRIKTDTSEFILAKPNGQWLGKSASGTVIENSILFLKKKLPVAGNYKFTFTQGMREASLNNIKDIGLKIVKRDEQNK
ncbi:MAG: gliding motility lipoprotein GldH [Flavobacteriales bacterium]